MYLVTAKVAAYDEDFPGSRVEWKVGQTREVHDSLVDRFRNNPAAWTVSGGNDSSPLSVSKTLTGMVRFFKDGIIVDNRIAIGSGLLLPVERYPVGA